MRGIDSAGAKKERPRGDVQLEARELDRPRPRAKSGYRALPLKTLSSRLGPVMPRGMVAPRPCRVSMRRVAVPRTMMRGAMMAMLGSLEFSAHQLPAAAGSHDLLVGHATASPRHALGDVDLPVVLMGGVMVPAARPVMRARRMVVVVRSVMVRVRRMMFAHVDPAVTWARPRHRREWRQRRRLGLRTWGSLRPFRHRLLGRRHRLVGAGLLGKRWLLLGRDLLRCDGRSEDRQRERCAGEGDTLQ